LDFLTLPFYNLLTDLIIILGFNLERKVSAEPKLNENSKKLNAENFAKGKKIA
jgi:hypothetical protein